MRVNAPSGLRTLISFGPKIRKSIGAQPDGLLLHENMLFSLFPAPRGNAPVLARLRLPGALGPIPQPPPGIAEEELYER